MYICVALLEVVAQGGLEEHLRAANKLLVLLLSVLSLVLVVVVVVVAAWYE